MLTGIPGLPLDGQGRERVVRALFRASRWNQYLANWPVVLAALHRLWEAGKVSELKSPFYEPLDTTAKK
jgi:Zn-dependent protease